MAEDSTPAFPGAQLIPSIYYDLIARVCAGVPFLGLLLWAQKDSFKEPIFSGIGFVLLVGAGYIAGLMLTPVTVIWSLLIGLPTRLILYRISSLRELLRHRSRNDEIALVDKDAGATLAKMQAEATLCQNLLSGFVVLIIANDSKSFTVSALDGRTTLFRWVIFSVLLGAAVFRTVVYIGRQVNLYQLYVATKAQHK